MLKSYFEEEEYNRLKESDDLLYKTLELVLMLFDDKVDKGGLPYFNHLLKVYSKVSDYDEKIIALLHDVVEDTNVTFDDLKEFGYNDEIIKSLTYLTKKKGEYYPDYIDRIINSGDIKALNVKLSDLKHNMDITRIKNPTVNDYERISKRYEPAYIKIKNKIDEIEER
ncbi:MAG: GTP pyrophosphokinase [Bacilli bacterium]|nr:GTP pyrophosphokinase [Bacilli bacterium]